MQDVHCTRVPGGGDMAALRSRGRAVSCFKPNAPVPSRVYRREGGFFLRPKKSLCTNPGIWL